MEKLQFYRKYSKIYYIKLEGGEKMNQKMERIVSMLSTTAALITAIVGVLEVILTILPSRKDRDGS